MCSNGNFAMIVSKQQNRQISIYPVHCHYLYNIFFCFCHVTLRPLKKIKCSFCHDVYIYLPWRYMEIYRKRIAQSWKILDSNSFKSCHAAPYYKIYTICHMITIYFFLICYAKWTIFYKFSMSMYNVLSDFSSLQ